MISFARLYRPGVVVSIAGQIISALAIPGVVAPRVTFRCSRSMSSTPDSAAITVFGLSPEQRAAIGKLWAETARAKITIAAGYEGITTSLFVGDARTMQPSMKAGPEYMTVINADDGGDLLADAPIPGALASTAGLTAQQMIDVALRCFELHAATTGDLPIVAHPSVAETIGTASPSATTLFYSSVAVGKARDLLDEAARTLGCRWWIRDSQLYMVRRGVPADKLAIVLQRDHWLDEPSEDGNGMVRLSTFLDPNITPGRQLVLVGRVAPGKPETFRVEAADYTGDTEGGAPHRVDCDLRRLLG